MHNNNLTDRVKNNRLAGKMRSRRGMTMAELMITIAIIMVLAAVAFIAVSIFQRTLAQKERDAIAQEIFVAAQNHLTLTKGEGYLEAADSSGIGTQDGTSKAYYFIVNNGSGFTNNETTMLDKMLPFGSIDESVRTGGSYIIRYQPKTATVLDVFYFSTSGTPAKFNHTIADNDNGVEYAYINGLKGDADKEQRRTYEYKSSEDADPTKAVLGWYGGEDLEPLGFPLEVPKISVVNGDKLTVNIHNPNFTKATDDNGVKLKLLVTGLKSKAKMSILIDASNNDTRFDKNNNFANNNCSFVLDDVTSNKGHFAELIDSNYNKSIVQHQDTMIPGEDIKVEAVAYSSKRLARIRFSKSETENSLFESISPFEVDTEGTRPNRIAFTNSLRHIENLDPEISGIASTTTDTGKFVFTEARQVGDITWGGDVFNSSCKVYKNGQGNSSADYYYPSNPKTVGKYDGLKHQIRGLKVNFAGPSGLFGKPQDGTSISNLELVDFDITASGNGNNAGALAGTLGGDGTVVSNVVAYNTKTFDDSKWSTDAVTSTIVSGAGSAGGLVGAMSAGGIEYSGAALVVSGSNNAGGLIGNASGVSTVDGCFSGGHTQEGKYTFKQGEKGPIYNVKATSGPAGGLIGTAGSAAISDSYSTCSASGSTGANTGGFVGTASGGITNCYSTGLTAHSANNAFIGTGSGADSTCLYLSIINEVMSGSAPDYKTAGDSNVLPIDADVDSYNRFVSSDSTWNPLGTYKVTEGNQTATHYAIYDNVVASYYKNNDGRTSYNFKTVAQLKQTGDKSKTSDKTHFVNRHYGDWPAPELFIVNTK